ncbi:hypothetical protein Hanom_Chr04g00379631 [Helianthus anomalus]
MVPRLHPATPVPPSRPHRLHPVPPPSPSSTSIYGRRGRSKMVGPICFFVCLFVCVSDLYIRLQYLYIGHRN